MSGSSAPWPARCASWPCWRTATMTPGPDAARGDRHARASPRIGCGRDRARRAHRSSLRARPHARAAALLRPQAGAGSRMLLVIDIAQLRDVNGLYGFAFGDELLRQFARRLTALAGAEAVVARMGGDRFAVLAPLPRAPRPRRGQARPWRCARAPVPSFGLRRDRQRACRRRLLPGPRHRLRGSDAGGRAGPGGQPAREPLVAAVRPSAQPGGRRPQDHGEGAATGARARRAGPSLPAAGRPRGRPGAGGRGSAALEPPGAGTDTAAELHPDRRGQRPHPPDRSLGAGEACRAARRWHDQGLEVGISVNVSAAQLKHQDLAGPWLRPSSPAGSIRNGWSWS